MHETTLLRIQLVAQKKVNENLISFQLKKLSIPTQQHIIGMFPKQPEIYHHLDCNHCLNLIDQNALSFGSFVIDLITKQTS